MANDIRAFFNRPISIGDRVVAKRLFLAPMAGLTHVAFRQLASEYGGYGLMFTEMCSARALPRENPAVSKVFCWRAGELDRLVCQIFGADPAGMAAAARRVEAEGFFGVDINFGCSVAAICKQNAGAALLKTPEQAAAIVRAVRKAVGVPVFVKFRIGWSDDPASAVDLARRFEDAGADALVFHPRVAPDRRSRPPKWAYIGRVKAAVSIPVFGNGEVFCLDDAQRMLAETGCDGVSLGRIAVARPWVFAEWTAGFEADSGIYHRCAHRMMALLAAHYEPVTALRRFKKWAVYFFAGFKYGHRFSAMLRGAKDSERVYATLDEIFRTPPEVAGRPNMNLFR
ncbi:MAG: tRNA dihydrouridine synthase [Thermodesulfobacteriota bacterium]